MYMMMTLEVIWLLICPYALKNLPQLAYSLSIYENEYNVFETI